MFKLFKRKETNTNQLDFLNEANLSIKVWVVEWYPPHHRDVLGDIKGRQMQKVFYSKEDAEQFADNLKAALKFVGDRVTKPTVYLQD